MFITIFTGIGQWLKSEVGDSHETDMVFDTIHVHFPS